jgi:predicted AAA+ superfamily ATPase
MLNILEYKKRKIEPEIHKLFEIFPIVSITGPRQCGKSTLIKHYTQEDKNDWVYITLDNKETLQRITEDPTLFVRSIKSNIAIDEAQKAPELFHSIKEVVDNNLPYKIILSGSANFLLMKNITESLAGRVGLLELQPFSIAEAYELKSNELVKKIVTSKDIDSFYNAVSQLNDQQITENEFLKFVLFGGFPKIHEISADLKWCWFPQYITTYIEKDLRDLSQIANLEAFQRLYKLLAYQTGQLLNKSNISSDTGIDQKTIAHYLSVLETSYQCKVLAPFHSRQRKQLIKSPKIFYQDTGLVNYHLKNLDEDSMLNRGAWGNILETHVLAELNKEIKNMMVPASLFFWRTNNGAEIDFIIEYGQTLYPIEVKASVSIKAYELRSMESFIEAERDKVPFGIVLHRSDKISFLRENILGVPISMLY